MNTIDKILIGCAIFLIAFTITMIIIFCVFQSVPDSLIEAVYGLIGGEAIVTFFIWWIKKKGQKDEKRHNQKTDK